MPDSCKHVLVIDDDAEFLAAVTDLIRAGGYEVRGMKRTSELFEDVPFPEQCCVLADVVLEGEIGLSLPGKLELLGYALPVVFMTATDDADTIRSATQAGALPCLTKPVEMDVLFTALDQALTLSRTMRHRALTSITPNEDP